MQKEIIQILKKVHKKYRKSKGTVSDHTKSAQNITSKWQMGVQEKYPEIIAEAPVFDKNKERIDLLDLANGVAYELKVSGKNTHHEFYKDLVKVLTYNLYHEKGKQIKKLIFLSEADGIKSLQKRLAPKFEEMLAKTHKLEIELISI